MLGASGRARGAAASVFVLAAALAAGEAFFRLRPGGAVVPDPVLGWKPAGGVRRWERGPRPRVLFIGDSFTQARQVAPGETYPAVVASELGASVSAYGADGWGTLQEALALEQARSEPAPEAVVLQACLNDVVENEPALERRFPHVVSAFPRPYARPDGTLLYALPRPLPAPVAWLAGHSALARGIARRLPPRAQGLMAGALDATGGDPDLPAAQAATARALARFKAAAGGARVLAFSVNAQERFARLFERLCAQAGIEVIGGVAEEVRAAERAGRSLRTADGRHWNVEGHRLAGRFLARELGRRLK